MNLGDRSIPLRERVKDFLETPPDGTRLDVIRMVADLAREAQIDMQGIQPGSGLEH
jgi:hypothetical protein